MKGVSAQSAISFYLGKISVKIKQPLQAINPDVSYVVLQG